uniref:Abhydrolase_3 domain-containing protein n=1 Tax=Strongyloides papillosus TaxID=174720 RepID=A0A0N5CF51_STREA
MIIIFEPIFGEQINYRIFRFWASVGPKLFSKKSKHVSIENITIANVPCRIYIPKESHNKAIIYIHGGGFMTLHPENYDVPCIQISRKTQSVIVSIDYSLSPEKKFPKALDECESVIFEFCSTYYKKYGIDKNFISVMGDSAGGNLTTTVCLRLARQGISYLINKNILIYPVTSSLDYLLPSYQYYYQRCNNSGLLNPQIKANILKFYLPIKLSKSDTEKILLNGHVPHSLRNLEFTSHEILPLSWREEIKRPIKSMEPDEKLSAKLKPYLCNPDFTPIMATYQDLSKLPKTLILTCGCDVLRDEGYLYYKKLQKANVDVEWRHYEDGIHGALNIINSTVYKKIINDIVEYLK